MHIWRVHVGPKFIAGLTIVQRRQWCSGRLDSDIDAGFAIGVDVDTMPPLAMVRETPIKLVAIGLIVKI
jgi:hypothetical protein